MDLYLAGSLVVKFFTNLTFTALLRQEISEFDDWNLSENQGKLKHIMPNLIAASSEVYLRIENRINEINTQCSSPLDPKDISQLMKIIRFLCHPDSTRRGDPKELSRKNDRDGLDRIRDRFIGLSKKAEVKLNKNYGLSS